VRTRVLKKNKKRKTEYESEDEDEGRKRMRRKEIKWGKISTKKRGCR
jgi:hypothetical protein